MTQIEIDMKKSAVSAALTFMKERKEWTGKPLRLFLQGKGCDGFVYGVCFDEMEENDLSAEYDGVKLVIDPDTYPIVKGATVEWVDDERGTGFLVENPNHDKFKGKFFRKKDWKERLL